MVKLPFIKMHGLGNDFVVLDWVASAPVEMTSDLAQRLCHRQMGIGADQILILKKPQNQPADVRMEIWNADGSTSGMCGNGIRAVALLKRAGRIDTPAGIKQVTIEGDQVTVDMGPPRLSARDEEIKIEGAGPLRFDEVDVGNPHAVIYVPKVADVPLEEWGARIELHARFAKRTNVEFVEIESPSRLRVRVWERGAGATLACGSGACAVVASAIASGRAKSPVEVHLPGGVLTLTWAGGTASLFMRGPATEVYRGEFVL